ncbi:penicillin-binding transpeptidase domain-containing protein, partial [Acinetobacter baumannii]|nr:penicillin-binding transpeptidase domain-containing protein [Acinetobacter baumannii]MCW1766275.1 penicillin-binding transpeptidase domain-containing protein [Acinetobacter baumannii]
LQEAEFAQLKKRPMRINFERQEEPLGMAPHFAQQLRKWLIDWADRNDYNIYTDGLVVHTTIDSRLQNWANQAVARKRADGQGKDKATDKDSEEDTLKALLADKAFMKQLREDKTRVQAGFVALNPATSEVLAWVGSRDFTQDAYDHVQQARRQPGSTFKPFVYGAALQQGATPDDKRVD